MVLQIDTIKSDTNKNIKINYLELSILNKQPVKNENIKYNIKINDQKNMQKNIQNNIQKKEKENKMCCCYNKASKDMRCCGLCYTFCYITNKDDQCFMCLNTFEEYYTSGYFITTCGYGETNEDCENCVPTVFCLPVKLPLFLPCLLGSIFNNCINCCRDTDANYLC